MVRHVASSTHPPRGVALGFSVHTGWAAMVAVTRSGGSVRVLDRRRVGMLPVPPTPRQDAYPYVYHAARELPLDDAGRFVRLAEEEARSRAREVLGGAVRELRAAGEEVLASAVITARESPQRALEEILKSHTLVHAAEGALFRSVIRGASEDLGLPVLQVPAPELVERAARALGLARGKVPGYLAHLGKELGPPWTADHKAASLAAVLALA